MIPCTDDSLSRLLAEVERDIAAELRAEIEAKTNSPTEFRPNATVSGMHSMHGRRDDDR